MRKHLICLLLIGGCSNSHTRKNDANNIADTLTSRPPGSSQKDIDLRNSLNKADSIVLASHYSPNEPIKDDRTGKYLPHFELIENGKLNESIIQERKKLDPQGIKELVDILFSPAIDDSIKTLCFQPRNSVLIYNSEKLLYIDVCFDCHGFTISQELGSSIIFDHTKYERLLQFYRNHGFKYMLD